MHYLMPNTSLFRDTEETEMAEILLYEAPRCESMARAEEPPIAIGGK